MEDIPSSQTIFQIDAETETFLDQMPVEIWQRTPEEEAELLETIAQSEADYAAGQYTTLAELKNRYASQTQEDAP